MQGTQRLPSPLSGYSAKAILILAGLTLSLLFYSYYSWRLVVVQQTPLLDTLMQVKVDLVDSHSKLMELVERHHEELDKVDISTLLSHAGVLTLAATQGDPIVGRVQGEVLDDAELDHHLNLLTVAIHELKEHLHPWLESNSYDRNSLGEVHDQLYAIAMKHAEACDERIHEVIFETLERQQKLFVLLLLIWGGSLAFVWWRWLAVNRLHEETSSTLRKLSRAVDQAGEFIMITDRNGMVEYVNPAFGRISGFADEEIIGQHVSLLGSGESSEPYLEQFDGTLPHDKEWHGEFTASRKSGDRYPAMMSISPIRGQSGEISHYVVIQQDMSDHEALQEQLRQSMKMESIGTLAGGIAHDFNNILAGFMGNIFLIRRDLKTANPSTLNQLATLEKLSQSAAKMVSQLLTFARKDIVRMQPFEFTPFFDLAVELARTVVPANVDFHHKNCTEGVQVFGSDNQLQQILINMVANANFAVKETDDPFILISAVPYVVDEAFREKHREVLASEFVRISVADNGCGISAEQIEKIFEPFYTTKEAGEGTGLGLSMVYGAVQRHGGVVEVESRLQEGTTFTIYLPQHEAGKADDAGENQDVVRGGGETILIVDDDFQVVETNRQLLLALGYNVLEAHDGLEAVEVYKGHIGQIDVVIMDCVMPKMGGAIAAKLIYKVDPQAKIIFMTGYDNEATIDEEFATPRTQMLFKPCSPGKLSQAIHKELESCC